MWGDPGLGGVRRRWLWLWWCTVSAPRARRARLLGRQGRAGAGGASTRETERWTTR